MVVFGLFSKKCASHSNTYSSSPTATIKKNKDVLDELMGLDNHYIVNTTRKSDLNTSSFDLEDIISKLPAKGEIDFKEALLNSLYAQVEYLRQDLFAKNEIIKSLVSIQSEYASNYNEVKNMSNVNDGTEANKSEFPDKPLNPLYNTISTGILESTVSSDDNDFAPWEKHSLGFGSKMLRKMGFNGGGLGKEENGIKRPIKIKRENFQNSRKSS